MTDPTQRRHDEVLGRLDALIDAVQPPIETDPCTCWECDDDFMGMRVCRDCGNKRCPRASFHNAPCSNSNDPNQPGPEPVDVTEERVIRDDHGGIITRTVDTAPDVDPDEALAKVLNEIMEDDWLTIDLARAAREHIADEKDHWDDWYKSGWESAIGRAEKADDSARHWRNLALNTEAKLLRAEADVERLTRERDEAREVAKSHIKDAGDWWRRYETLRKDVEAERDAARASRDSVSDGNLGWILARDDERGQA